MFEAIEEALAEFKAILDAFRNSKKTPEQIEKAKELYDSLDPGNRSLLEYIFPEVVESEDERIRKSLLAYIKGESKYLDTKKWIAYLEKQKESNKALRLVGKGFLSDPDAYFEVVSEEQKEQKDYRKLYDDIAKSEWFKKAYAGKSLSEEDEQKEQKGSLRVIKDASEWEKIKDQKPEEWSEDERIRQDIIALIEFALNDSSAVSPGSHTTKEEALAYLEKLKDASKAIEAVDRIDKYIDEHLANAHDMKDSNPDKKYYSGWDAALGEMSGILQDVYSNEKQKEQPMSAIDVLTRAGLKPYKDGNQWCILAGDNIQEGICGFGDTIDGALMNFLKEVSIIANSPQLKEQKALRMTGSFADGSYKFEVIDIPKPVEWSTYDKATIEYIIEDIKELRDEETDEEVIDTYDRELNLLQCINDSVKLCNYTNPTEWSEEDEKMKESIISTLKANIIFTYQHDELGKADHENIITWLKSLRPQPHWKPSEEQMKALLSKLPVIKGGGDKVQDILESLYNDLKNKL